MILTGNKKQTRTKKDEREIVVISLGGSILVPEKPDINYIKKLRKILLKHLNKMRFIIVVGGGKLAREYISRADKITPIEDTQKDWIGIHATRLNAALVKGIFKEKAHPNIITDYKKRPNFKEDIMVGAGYVPGWSTDYDAVLLAKMFDVKTIVNLTNTDFVYDKDPRKYRSAKALKDLRWREYFSLIEKKFTPGLNAPFDPVASREAKKENMKVLVAHGKHLDNLDKLLYGEIFSGTIIQ